MQNSSATVASESSSPVYQLTAEGVSYQMLLPNAGTDFIQRTLAGTLAPYEFDMLKDMQLRLSRGDLVLDVGANIGNHTMFLAAVAGCRVAAFEPNKELSLALGESALLSGVEKQVSVHAQAVGRLAQRGHFATELPANLGAQQVEAGDGPIEIITLDSMVFDAPVKAIKIDVEGMERDVLEGAAALVKSDRPMIYVECQDEASFRSIHQWMLQHHYSYWDTFNATPTHLFLADEKISAEQRVANMQFRVAHDAYQNKVKFDQTRQALDNANLKYRNVTEQVGSLKVQLVQEQTARSKAEQEASATSDELKRSADGFAAERKALQQEIDRLQASGQQGQKAAQAAEAQLARIDQALATTAAKLREVQNQQELAKSEAEQLKAQLSASRAELERERASLGQEIARLNVQAHMQSQVVRESDIQRTRAEEQLSASRASLDEARQQQQSSAVQVERLTNQLEHNRDKAEYERRAILDESSRLAERIVTLEHNAQDSEREVVRLQAALELRRAELEKATVQNELANRHLQVLEQNSLKFEQQIAELTQREAQLLLQRGALDHEIAALRRELASSAEQANAAQVRLQQLIEELTTARMAIDAAAAEGRQREAQLEMLKSLLSQGEAAVAASEQLRAETQGELEETRALLRSEEALAQASKKSWLETQAELDEVKALLLIEEAAAQASRKSWLETRADLDAMNEQFRQVSERNAATQNRLELLEGKLRTESAARSAAEHAWKTSQSELGETQEKLQQANVKYRLLAGEEVPKLKEQLQAGLSRQHLQTQELEKLQQEIAAAKKTVHDLSAKAQRLEQMKQAAEQQVLNTRASLSFRLGYILIHGFKSLRGFINLPAELLSWRKEVVRRRAQKDQRQSAWQPAKVAASDKAIRVTSKTPARSGTVPATVVPAKLPKNLRSMKMATIMDEFTFGSYAPECEILQLTPAGWQAELDAFQPELLFIESAWRGKDELWGSKVGHNSQEVQGIVAWCRAHQVPTVFWNKEDPVHFETFLSTAKLFDHVFTTDIDCIHRYKAALQHERVYLLPFACQPANNNPIETYERKDAFCFAGAYYVRYPERTRDLGNFVSALPTFRPLEIYDRNFGKNDPNYQFPPEYQPYIVGTLPFDQIDKAYKGYRYAINLNSIKQSQSMFARRVFELLASNTITVSNFSRGVRLMFGDLVVTTDSGEEMVRHLQQVAGDDVRGAKLRLAALRKVLQEHTYGQRLAYIASKVSGELHQPHLPAIAVLASARDQRELDLLTGHFERQTYQHFEMQVVLAPGFAPSQPDTPRLRLVTAEQAQGAGLAAMAGPATLLAGFVAGDYYGPNYLLDIALATRFSNADVIGKSAHYVWLDGQIRLDQNGAAYRPATGLAARSSACRLASAPQCDALTWLADLDQSVMTNGSCLAIDEFNYCRNGGAADPAVMMVDDLQDLNTGIRIDELLARAEAIQPAQQRETSESMISGAELAKLFGKLPSSAIQLAVEGEAWKIHSTLADGKQEYIYATQDIAADVLADQQGVCKFYLETTPGLNLQVVLVYFDAHKQKLSHVILHCNRNQEAKLPLGTAWVRLGVRVYASGSADIKGFQLGHRATQPATVIGQAEDLVLTNHYPSYEDLYRNAFVHSRVVAYRERGVRCDVFRLAQANVPSFHEFEGVDVITGAQAALHQLLSSGKYKSVLVHFLDAAMWEVLQHHVDRVKIVVWVHGAEIQPWHRREFNYANDNERTVAKMKSDARAAFWTALLRDIPANLKLVFVSNYFAEEVMEDLGFRLPTDSYTIIHNPIDTDTFDYVPKPAEQRKKILSIRPYASAKYANDLSVEAIRILSSKPWFDQLEFHLLGDGELFDATLAPLRGLPNVRIERRFLKQAEIARLHKEYGIFLCPTRMDAQGVSRDEAMASGLVPVTNAVTAIPEFVDTGCGILAPGDDAQAMADGIAMLYEQPERFLAMSQAATARVARQSAKPAIIDAELTAFNQYRPAPVKTSLVAAPPVVPAKDCRTLKMATIMDEFTFGSYAPECEILQLTPAGWQAELEAFQPELLFIESAWRGKDELWGSKVGHNSQEVQGIVAWCRAHQVPTVFWNKEDPVHFETFLSTAKLFDHVFTTDIDCIHRYKAALQHERVYLLPFACQPANNNPIETYERKDAFCFAGAYYVRYPERTRDLGNFVSALPTFRPLEIYDRNFGKNDPNYQFPPEYQPYIVGTLPFDQIDKAYKGYRYAINLNSIKQSQSMFARRVFELLASNTITVSNFSRGVRLMFGDLVVTTDSGDEMVRHLQQVAGDDVRGAKLRLAALRKVLQEHTYGQRLDYVLSKVTGHKPASRLPSFTALGGARDQRELDLLLGHFQRQTYQDCRLLVVLAPGFSPASPRLPRVRLISAAQAKGANLAAIAQPADLLAGMLASDYYGPNYLLDIALTTLYSNADVIGKAAVYACLGGSIELLDSGCAYRPAASLPARSAAIRLSSVANRDALQWVSELGSATLNGGNCLAIDEYNYCRDGAAEAYATEVSAQVNDLDGLDTGIGIDDLLASAEAIQPEVQAADKVTMISGRQLAAYFDKAPSRDVQLTLEHDSWHVQSVLADGKHEYLYATTDLSVDELELSDSFKFYFDITPGLNLQLVVTFLDSEKQKISHVIKHATRNQETDIPQGTAFVRFGLRFYAAGTAEIKGLVLGHRNIQPAAILGRADRLVLTNHYPSYDDLYRNAFVHSRVAAYRERGVECDVFRMRPEEPLSFHEFEDVDVITGAQEALHLMLASGRYKTVLVHFLNAAMWDVLQHYTDRVKVVVWVHGIDIQPWHRRSFNYETDAQRAAAQLQSDERMAFWRGLLKTMPSNLHLVFVSRHSADEAMEDLGWRLPPSQYSIIHNPIDTDTFMHTPKPSAQRKKVLSIRPYSSATYANDLSVRAIELLASEPWFKDMEFRMIGDGALFEQTLEPLRQYSNVHIEKRFLKKDEIASLHKEYGVFLVPSRMDTHGVSRDEAMASGLVPVTNAVAAIPEFVDTDCGVLAPGEDAITLARGLARLYEDREHFAQLSEAAAKRVRKQSAKSKIIDLELGLA